MKKTQLTILFFLINFASFAGNCFPGEDQCETDDPLDSHIIILMLFVAIFSIYSINKKLTKSSVL